MIRTRTVASTLVLCVCLSTVSIADGQRATPAPSRGTQIGQMVPDAINSAFPAFSKIMDLFGTRNRASKDQVQTAVSNAQKDFETEARQKVQPVASISRELTVTQTFARAGVSASPERDGTSEGVTVNRWQYFMFQFKNGQVADPADPSHLMSLMEALTLAGQGSWELVTVVPAGPNAYEFIFKRPSHN